MTFVAADHCTLSDTLRMIPVLCMPIHLAECDNGSLPIPVSVSMSCQPNISEAMRSVKKSAVMYSCPWNAMC